MAPETSSTAVGGFMHSALVVKSDQTLRDLLVPAVLGALGENDEVFVALSAPAADALRAGLGPSAGALHWGEPATSRQRLGFAYEAFRRFLADAQAAGRRVAVFAEPGITGLDDGRVAACLAYESAGNEAYAPYGCPVTCLWDARRHPAAVIDGARRVHPHHLTASGPVPSPGYLSPGDYLGGLATPISRPAEADWTASLDSPDELPALREELRDWAREQGFAPAAAADVTLAVSEIATNGLTHGRPPVAVLAWHDGDLLIAQVEDRGGIPLPPWGGYRPPDEGQDRTRGLWLARQLADVMRSHSADGQTTVRLYFPYQLTHRRPPYLSDLSGPAPA